jgi:hypothetical protein
MWADGSLLSGKELIYSLRIRNGTPDTVASLLLYDTLDARLDIMALHIFDADFSYTATLLPGSVLRIMSSGAKLAPGAESAIRFGIMPVTGIVSGTIITNRISVVLNGLPEGESNTVYSMAARPAGASGVGPAAAGSDDVRVYPVPAEDGAFYISVSGSHADARYELLDMRGAVCARGLLSGQKTRVDASALVPGIYLVRVVTNGSASLRKMVIAGKEQ